MKKIIIFVMLFFLVGQINSYSQVIFEKKLGSDGYSDYPSNIIKTIENNCIFTIYSSPKSNNNQAFSTIYMINPIGEIVNSRSVVKNDTSVKINYLSKTFASNQYIGVGSLRSLDDIFLWIFQFNSELKIINEQRIEIPNAEVLSRANIIKSHFDYYITYQYYNIQNGAPYTRMLHYKPVEDSIILSDWEMSGLLGDFEKNNFGDGFLIAGTFLSRTMTTIWEVSQDMELISLNDNVENDIYHLIDLEWSNNNLIHAGSYQNPQFQTTRFMGIQLLDSSLSTLNFSTFGEIGIWNYAGSNEAIALSGNNTIYFTGTEGVVLNPYTAFDNHIAVHKMDTTLNVNWSYLIGGDAYYMTRSINTTSDGGCIIAATRYDEALQNQENDVYLIAMGPDGLDTGIDDGSTVNEVVLYPNPGNEMINLDTKEHQFIFHLYNNTGQLVLAKENQRNINTSALSSGIYFYRIIKNGQILSSGKWVKR